MIGLGSAVLLTVNDSGCSIARTTSIRVRGAPCLYQLAISQHCCLATRRTLPLVKYPSREQLSRTLPQLWRTLALSPTRVGPYLQLSSRPITSGERSPAGCSATTKSRIHGSQKASMQLWSTALRNGREVCLMTIGGVAFSLRDTSKRAKTW